MVRMLTDMSWVGAGDVKLTAAGRGGIVGAGTDRATEPADCDLLLAASDRQLVHVGLWATSRRGADLDGPGERDLVFLLSRELGKRARAEGSGLALGGQADLVSS